MSIFTLY